MKKRLACLVLALAMIVSTLCVATTSSAISDADFVAPEVFIPEYIALPDNDLLTDNTSFVLAEGTRNEIKVTTEFVEEGKAWRPGTINYMKYIVVHNTGSYPASSTALANHNYGRTSTASVSWHYTCGNDGIYQMLPVNEKGWHAGGNYWNDATIKDKVEDGSNSTGIGIETCVDGFPADSSAGGEHWNSDEMYEWYETHYDQTATYLAMLVAYISVRLNFNPYTQTITHYQTAAKNCPMQMRYIFGTNAQFTINGTYFKVFLDRMYDYYEAFGGTYTSTDTLKNTYYNPGYKSYATGLYSASSDVTVYRAGNTTTGTVGTVTAGSVVDVTVTGWNWGRITLADGTVGWVDLDSLTFVTGDYDYGTYRTAEGEVVNVTAINGTTATYEGGTADITTLTRVYKVTVEGDTEFGSEPKYLASGEKFSVTAVEPVAPMLFDIWEVTYGIAQIEDKEALKTTVTVLNSDVTVRSSQRDKYDLIVEYGTGSGRYNVGDEITVIARARVGYTFKNWTVVSGAGEFVDPNVPTAVFKMGEADTEIKAVYQISQDIDLSGLTNYGLGSKYTFTWKDQTGADIAWRGSLKDLECTKMTDGAIATSGFTENKNLYLGVMGSFSVAEFVFTLDDVHSLSKIVLRDIADNGGSFGDIDSTSIEVYVSNDGTEFTAVEGLADTLYFSYKTEDDGSITQFTNIYTHSIDFASASAKYVKVRFKSTKYLLAISEVEIYGPEASVPVGPKYELGDVNNDEKVTSLDAALVLQYDAAINKDIDTTVADVNGDGKITSLDAAFILQLDAGLIDSFPAAE